jgi:hypothetical protein
MIAVEEGIELLTVLPAREYATDGHFPKTASIFGSSNR